MTLMIVSTDVRFTFTIDSTSTFPHTPPTVPLHAHERISHVDLFLPILTCLFTHRYLCYLRLLFRLAQRRFFIKHALTRCNIDKSAEYVVSLLPKMNVFALEEPDDELKPAFDI